MADVAAMAVVREHVLLLRALARARRLCTEQPPETAGVRPRGYRLRGLIGACPAVPWP